MDLVYKYLKAIFIFWIVDFILTILHELGHGLTAIFFSKGSVVINIGFYENPNYKITFKLGKITFIIEPSFLNISQGQCKFETIKLNLDQEILVVMFGALTPVIILLVSCYFIFKFDNIDSIQIFILLVLIKSLIDVFRNFYPNKNSKHESDGKRLLFLFRIRRKLKKRKINYNNYYKSLKNLIVDSNFEMLLDTISKENIQSATQLYFLKFYCYLNLLKIEESFNLICEIEEKYKVNIDTFFYSQHFIELELIIFELLNDYKEIKNLTSFIELVNKDFDLKIT